MLILLFPDKCASSGLVRQTARYSIYSIFIIQYVIPLYRSHANTEEAKVAKVECFSTRSLIYYIFPCPISPTHECVGASSSSARWKKKKEDTNPRTHTPTQILACHHQTNKSTDNINGHAYVWSYIHPSTRHIRYHLLAFLQYPLRGGRGQSSRKRKTRAQILLSPWELPPTKTSRLFVSSVLWLSPRIGGCFHLSAFSVTLALLADRHYHYAVILVVDFVLPDIFVIIGIEWFRMGWDFSGVCARVCVYVTLAETRTRKQHQIPPQPSRTRMVCRLVDFLARAFASTWDGTSPSLSSR